MKSFIVLGVMYFLILAGVAKTADMAYAAFKEIRRRWKLKKAAQKCRAQIERRAYSKEVMATALDFRSIVG